MIALGLALAALIGVALGLMGGGGSILTVPIFVYVLGFGAKEAIAMSLAVVGTVSLFGVAGHWRSGNVNVRVALVFGGVAMIGTYGGARLAAFVSGTTQLVLFAAVMLVAAWFMLRTRGSGAEVGAAARETAVAAAGRSAGSAAAQGVGASGPVEVTLQSERSLSYGWIAAEGIAVGVLTGLVGVGGGFLIVPALVLLGGLTMKEAVGTSLLVIALKSGAGFWGYAGQVEVPWAFLAGFSAVAVLGILLGTHLVRYVSQEGLRRGFAAFLVVMGTFILYENRSVLLPESVSAETTVMETAGKGR